MEDQSTVIAVHGSEVPVLGIPSGKALAASRSPSRNLEDAPGGSGPIHFVYENPSVDSLEFEEPIRLYHCTVSGCKVTCKRSYELKRHRQTVHNQSQHWFCPVDSCWLSCAFVRFAKIDYHAELRGIYYHICRQRHPLTSTPRFANEDDGYVSLELNGFTRKDKLTKHLKKAHKEDFFRLGGTPVGKECSKDRPLICDLQLFWVNLKSATSGSLSMIGCTWCPRPLWRLQLDDGTWSAYVGHFQNRVAEAGFRCWTRQDDESFKRLGQDLKFVDVVPWQAHDLVLKLGSDAPMPKRTALQDYQMQLMLLEQQNKKRLMVARQEQDAPFTLCSWTTETQHTSNGQSTNTSDVSAHADCVLKSASCTENLQHNASLSALSSGVESTPGPYENTQIDGSTLLDAGGEAEFAEIDWDAILSAELNSGSDSNYVALDNGENLAFEFNDPAFDLNNPAFDPNNLAGDLDDLDNLAFNFNDLASVPDWYFDVENATEPEL